MEFYGTQLLGPDALHRFLQAAFLTLHTKMEARILRLHARLLRTLLIPNILIFLND